MESHKITAFLITGQPGVGKTTLVRKICDKLKDRCKLQGFYTGEVRESGERLGFDVITMDGKRSILARVQPTDNIRRPKVGKYAVYVQDFEDLSLPVLKIEPHTQQLLIIDEIGKMELFSKRFEAVVNVLLQEKQPMLATIPLRIGQPIELVERLRNSPDAVVYQVTRANRDTLVESITKRITETLLIP